MYGDVLSWFAKRTLGVRLADLEKHDLGVVARATQFDPLFPGDRMVSAILGFVGTMGVDATAGGKIRLDLEARPKKSPRAFCSAVRVPDEVYLVIRPSGGIEDYKAFLHELGHALHFGHTDPAAAWEARRLGDNSVTETYAMLFDHLLHDRLWLRKVAGISDARALLRHSAFIELMMLRRYSAKFAYELELHARPSREGCRELYRDMLTHATKARYSVAHYLADVDAFFYSARYLRAWMLQQAAALALRDRFDEDWFLNPRAGTYLTQLWASGQGVSAEELAREFGQQTLTMEPLRRQLEQVLGA
jgi:oligoendopeptidase F